MTTYNTGNALGSSDARDLYDNAENIDNFANGSANTYTDRLGVTRKSLSGMRNAVDDFIESSGYTVPVAYTSGIVLSEYNQLIEYNDEFYKLKAGQAPYTTTGTWGTDSAKLVSVGDAALRQELTANANDFNLLPEIANYAALRAYTGDVTAYYVRGVANIFDGGAGVFRVKSGDTTSADNGGTLLVDAIGRRWFREFSGSVNLRWFGAKGDGVADDYPAAQNVASSANSVDVSDGVYKLSQHVVMSVPKSFVGNGATTRFEAQPGFTGSIFRIAPAAGTDPKGWTVSDFEVTNNGAASNVFLLDIAAAGAYISKFTLSKIISNTQVSNYFVELLNSTPNADGLFTSVFSDNWSLGGYYLDSVGDSVYLERNTTSGAGVGYYVNQLETAANVTIRDGNCTSAGGALNMVRGQNLTFDNMQVECPVAFTGANNAAVSIDRPAGGVIINTKIINSNINTQGNPLYCIYLDNAVQTIIDGNELYCDVSTGAHIYIDAGARDTVIGNNKYYNRATGEEVDPIIINNGVGTVGAWVDASLTLSWWTAQGTSTEHAPGFYKDRDGNVMLRGRAAGPGATPGQTLFTLPVGYRPKTKGYLIQTYGSSTYPSIVLQIIPSGEVQILTAGTTGVYLSGVVFSTK